MEKRIIEMEDNLQDIVDEIKEEIKDDFISYLEEKLSVKDFDEYYQAQGLDFSQEISDSSTPIYYTDIDNLYYLYGNEFDEAYNSAGIGNGNEDNYRQVSICCYLEEKAQDYLYELEVLFDNRNSTAELIDELNK